MIYFFKTFLKMLQNYVIYFLKNAPKLQWTQPSALLRKAILTLLNYLNSWHDND